MKQSEKIEKATKFIESKFPVGASKRHLTQCDSITGEPYMTIVTGGIKKEGDFPPFLATTRELAVEGWVNAVMNYAENKGTSPVLYWRTKPYFMEFNIKLDEESRMVYIVYSRLLISSNPPR